MTTPDYTQKMSELRVRVEQYAKLPSPSKNGFSKATYSVIPKINMQSPTFYIAPPIILIILFFFMKPGFVCTENIDVDNVVTKKVNFKKLLISGLIGGGIISVGLFAYFRKKI